jgi:hypothetical protein
MPNQKQHLRTGFKVGTNLFPTFWTILVICKRNLHEKEKSKEKVVGSILTFLCLKDA